MLPRLRTPDVVATLLAAGGIALAVQAWRAGSLFRYVLAGQVVGALSCLPLLTLLVWRQRAQRFWRQAMFAVVPLLALLVLLELGVRWLGPVPESPVRLRADARLGHVIEPGTAGTDAQGFRNPIVPTQVDVLCVGDSQTWGFAVEREATFSAVLRDTAKVTTYQMADGSYGPVQYRELVRRGLNLRPRLVVIALYFGNDFVDAFDYAALDGAEDLRTAGQQYPGREMPEGPSSDAPNWTMAMLDAMCRMSRVLDFSGSVVKSRLHGGLLDEVPGSVAFSNARVPTILLPDYRCSLVELDNPNVNEGLQVTLRCLQAIATLCQGITARGILLTIPTKEYCYQAWQLGKGTPVPELAALYAAEHTMRSQVFAGAAAAGLEVVDITPACVAALEAGIPVWHATADGHLTKEGHAVAARLLAENWAGK